MATVAGGGNMMTREQLLHLFSRFSFLTSLPEVKNRIADAVRDKQEAVAVTTEIQEEILREMGIDPSFGIGCLGKLNAVFENDMDLMIKFYQFVAKEEMAIDEAELEPIEFAMKIHDQQELQQQQLEMLVQMRKHSPESQSVILETLHKQLESANFDTSASILTPEQIQEIVQNSSHLPKE
ncbi:uncharacterized protein LOC100824229 [Brachypodium distachyon]|uniref:Uncharacterized protein n=1 Tax=Brachypodium distachyon TaxID=15368 RepID=I1ILT1_BRADI|nr:uncharacterized protein LOC100824229 [Brachypodium distachyon]KQJ88540.1 hypothetical protein BRADI_4g19220v3 [Brachypodium distachyon]|eukprot:XP_003577578.1 uncharacterized protein LOC100824229 [Brachypodium distachyon]